MALYPSEYHHFLDEGKPSCRLDASQRIIDWISRDIGEPAPAMQTNGGQSAPSGQVDTAPA